MILRGNRFAMHINMPTRVGLMAEVRRRFGVADGFALATINLDHVTKLERDDSFRRAYAAQDLVVADGNPIVWLSRIAGRPVELMPGSELVEPLARLAAECDVSVALVGSTDASLAKAAEALCENVQGLRVVYRHAPDFGFDPEGAEAREILRQIDASGAQLVFVALGAPKQERFAAFGRELAPAAGFASVGAGLDFLSGTQVRAPIWVRRIAMEWLWRMLGNPRRLFTRYALCAIALPGLGVRATFQRFKRV